MPTAESHTAETVTLDGLSIASRASGKAKERQGQYDAALQSLVVGGDAQVFHLAPEDVDKKGRPSGRGLKLRISYAVKRLKLNDVRVVDATFKGKPVVAAFIPAPKPAKPAK